MCAAMSLMILSGCSSREGYKRRMTLENDIDSLSYMLGITNTQGLMDYLRQDLKVSEDYMDDFFKGFDNGVEGISDKDRAYMAGVQIGERVSKKIFEGLNTQVFGHNEEEQLSKDLFLKGFVGTMKYPDKMSTMAAQKYIDENMMRIHDRVQRKD